MLRRLSSGLSDPNGDNTVRLSSRAQAFVAEMYQKQPSSVRPEAMRQKLQTSIKECEAKLEDATEADKSWTMSHINVFRKQLEDLEARHQIFTNNLLNQFGLSLEDIAPYLAKLEKKTNTNGTRRRRGVSLRALDKTYGRFFPQNRKEGYQW